MALGKVFKGGHTGGHLCWDLNDKKNPAIQRHEEKVFKVNRISVSH